MIFFTCFQDRHRLSQPVHGNVIIFFLKIFSVYVYVIFCVYTLNKEGSRHNVYAPISGHSRPLKYLCMICTQRNYFSFLELYIPYLIYVYAIPLTIGKARKRVEVLMAEGPALQFAVVGLLVIMCLRGGDSWL